MNNKGIYNLSDLINALNSSGKDDIYLSVLSKIKFNFKDIEHLCFWDAESYSKISIGSGNNYTLDLICWEKEQKSPIHHHEVSQAWAYVIKGEVEEKIFSKDNNQSEFLLEESKSLKQKKPYRLNHNSKLFHQLFNTYTGKSVSLHLYVK